MRSDRSAARRGRALRPLPRRFTTRPAAGVLVAVVAALVVSACGSSSSNTGVGGFSKSVSAGQTKSLYGSLPAAGTPTHGGTMTVGQVTGVTPTYIFPIIPSANNSAYTSGFVAEMFLPLYAGPLGDTPTIDYALSLATKPTFSNGDKTVTIHMKQGYKWADGAPVDANDVIFATDLLKAALKANPANWGQYVPGQFPLSVVSATAPSKYTVVFMLNKAYNPSYFLNNQIQDTDNFTPLPSTAWNIASAGGPHLDYTNPANALKIYNFLSHAGGQVGGFASNPLWKDVNGPWQLKDFNATNSSYDLVPNPHYTGPAKPYLSDVSVETFTGITAQLNALKSGQLDIGGLDFSQLPQVPSLKTQGYSVFGYPPFGWFAAVYNFKDTTNHFNSIISQLYVRQALAELENQPAYVKGIFKNAAVASYGPVPPVPVTPFTPSAATHPPYSYNPSGAVALLKSHGWNVVPGGQTTCAKAGSGPGECGSGIPSGTPFTFTWFYPPASEAVVGPLESEAFASQAKQTAGINIQLQSKTFNFLISNYADSNPADAKYVNDWGVNDDGGISYDYYPTSAGIFNTGGGLNNGGYSDPTADSLINASTYGSNPNAVINEASYLTKNQPVLFFPNSDYIYAVSKRVGGPPDAFLALTELTAYLQSFYIKK